MPRAASSIEPSGGGLRMFPMSLKIMLHGRLQEGSPRRRVQLRAVGRRRRGQDGRFECASACGTVACGPQMVPELAASPCIGRVARMARTSGVGRPSSVTCSIVSPAGEHSRIGARPARQVEYRPPCQVPGPRPGHHWPAGRTPVPHRSCSARTSRPSRRTGPLVCRLPSRPGNYPPGRLPGRRALAPWAKRGPRAPNTAPGRVVIGAQLSLCP